MDKVTVLCFMLVVTILPLSTRKKNYRTSTATGLRYCHRVTAQLQLNKYYLKADSHIACRAHAVPLSCRAAKGLEYVFPI